MAYGTAVTGVVCVMVAPSESVNTLRMTAFCHTTSDKLPVTLVPLPIVNEIMPFALVDVECCSEYCTTPDALRISICTDTFSL